MQGSVCDARIRHIDHITRYSDGARTTYINGRGECERGNLVREMPGWRIKLLDCGFHGGLHAIMITTPLATTIAAAPRTHHDDQDHHDHCTAAKAVSPCPE